jgi:hypothetical protein
MLLKHLSLWPKSATNDSNILSEKGKQCNCSVDCPQDGGEIGQKLTGTQISGLKSGHTVFTSTGIYWSSFLSHVYITHLSPGGDHVSFTCRTRRRRWRIMMEFQIMQTDYASSYTLVVLTCIVCLVLSGILTTQLVCTHFPQHWPGMAWYWKP